VNANDLAALLTGREYRSEITRDEAAQAKAAGLIVAFGASDDLLELRGAIHDEVGCYGGGSARIDRAGVVPSFDSIDRDDQDALRDYFKRENGGVTIDAVWAGEAGYSWIIRTTIPHETFEIVEDGEPYCRGIVFDLADVPA
jgi:hypothetical protein